MRDVSRLRTCMTYIIHNKTSAELLDMDDSNLSETALSNNFEKVKGIDGKGRILVDMSFWKRVCGKATYELLLVGYLDVDLSRATHDGEPLIFDPSLVAVISIDMKKTKKEYIRPTQNRD